MAMSLTHAQSELLHYIEAYQAENDGVSPTYEEMKEHLGLLSKSGVFRLIEGLEERRRIKRIPNRARAIEIVAKSEDFEGATDSALRLYPTTSLIAELARRHWENKPIRA